MRDKIFTQSYIAPRGHYESDEDLVPIDELTKLPKTHAIEGVLLLTVNGVPLINRELWDDVDCLWCEWISAIEKIITSSTTMFYFPDQAIEVWLEKVGSDKLRVMVHGRSVVVDRKTFCVTMLERAAETFDKLAELRKDMKRFFKDQAARARKILQQYVDG